MDDEFTGGVEPGGIFRMKFMGAFGLESDLEKSPGDEAAGADTD